VGATRSLKTPKDEGLQYHFILGKELHPKILKSILRDADLAVEEFLELMK
jgi:hypothetical protein